MSNGQQARDIPVGDRLNSGNTDTRTLVGLLENLLPLLLHFQSQTLGPGGTSHFAGTQSAHLDQQAAIAFTEDIILDALRNVSGYLEQNASRAPGLEAYAGVVGNARHAFAARDYQASLALILEAYRAITVVRSVKPDLPPIRRRDASEQTAAGGSVH